MSIQKHQRLKIGFKILFLPWVTMGLCTRCTVMTSCQPSSTLVVPFSVFSLFSRSFREPSCRRALLTPLSRHCTENQSSISMLKLKSSTIQKWLRASSQWTSSMTSSRTLTSRHKEGGLKMKFQENLRFRHGGNEFLLAIFQLKNKLWIRISTVSVLRELWKR